MVSFPQLSAVKKDSKNGAARKIFGPSYFVTTLVAGFLSSKIEQDSFYIEFFLVKTRIDFRNNINPL